MVWRCQPEPGCGSYLEMEQRIFARIGVSLAEGIIPNVAIEI
jgi:hypothetical protein